MESFTLVPRNWDEARALTTAKARFVHAFASTSTNRSGPFRLNSDTRLPLALLRARSWDHKFAILSGQIANSANAKSSVIERQAHYLAQLPALSSHV